MLSIKIICVGKLKEKFWTDAAAEYAKRLSACCRLEIEELPETRLPANPSAAEIEAALGKEGEGIALRVPQGALNIAMCIEGRELDSEQLAQFLQLCASQGKSRLCFLIGGSHGLHEGVKQGAALRLSMSKMTFPHHLARVMLLEQLYRAFQIIGGGKYHK